MCFGKIICNPNNDMTVDIINSRINRFDCGRYDAVNKLSPNFTSDMLKNKSSKSKQKAAQNILFGKVVALMFGDLISVTDPYFELILTLCYINDIKLFTVKPYLWKTLLCWNSTFPQYLPNLKDSFLKLFQSTNFIIFITRK